MKDLSSEEITQVMKTAPDGVLAFTDGERPYCIPFGFVYTDSTVYITMFPKGRKWDCFQKNPNVCFNVFRWNDEHTEWSSVVADGKMEQITDLAEIKEVVKANIEKMGLNPDTYLDKRMAYYEKSLNNPSALKAFRIAPSDIRGKKMHTMMGE